MSKNVKNQHYVPRMYLKRFTSDNNRFCVWNLNKDCIIPRQRPENFAARRYFYDTNKEELKKALGELVELYPAAETAIDYDDEQFVEKTLSRMESDVSKTIDIIAANHELLYNEDNMRKIIIFLHDLAFRSEEFRNQLESVRSQIIAHLERMGIAPEQVEGMQDSAKDEQLYQILGFAPLLKTTIALLENYDWYIGIVPGKMKLVISDNPAQGVRFGFNDICIPLNGEKAIIFRIKDTNSPIISKDIPLGKEIILSERSVYVYNTIQWSYANRFVFGDKDSLAFLQKMVNRQNGISDNSKINAN